MYRDTITYEELADARPRFGLPNENPAERIMRDRRHQLMKKSGADNVSNARLTVFEDLRLMTIEMRVSFDSRAWTGR